MKIEITGDGQYDGRVVLCVTDAGITVQLYPASGGRIDARGRMVLAVLDIINPIDTEFTIDITEAEIDEHVRSVARFVTGLADALVTYVDSGVVEPLPAATEE